MRRWRGLGDTPVDPRRRAVTIGNFDGVHLGHQQIIGRTLDAAREQNLLSTVLTFDPHPIEVLRPGTHPAVLTPLDRKAELLAGLGVDELCVLPFTPELAAASAAQFIASVLVDGIGAAVVVVGENFRFGNRAAGDVTTLQNAGETLGFNTVAARIVSAADGSVLSSTAIRARIADGDVSTAARALSRPHRLCGVVERGDRRGRELGYPTANVAPTPQAAIPADGVYAGRLHWRGGDLAAAVSIGTNPTFDGADRRVEAYALDFDGDLYDEHVCVDFLARLRPTLRFDGAQALIDTMGNDVVRTRAVCAGDPDPGAG